MDTPRPDLSVRVALAADAGSIADVQIRAWRVAYADVLPSDLLASLDREAFASQWAEAVTKPADARNRVLVALEGTTVTGVALTAPADDPDAHPATDGQIAEFAVDPERTGHGHGSRLLQACADALRADGFDRASVWVTSTDDALRGFLTEAGWAPDGAHRELDLTGDGRTRVKQVRLHTDLRED
ncbi:MAG: GNAT family N-acetyltransferase [Propionibacteriales bacterium]|nr:GNAT family N-acetyltransferase [Propionibacteriales bacterium]